MLKINDSFWHFSLIIIILSLIVFQCSVIQNKISFLPNFKKSWTLFFHVAFTFIILIQSIIINATFANYRILLWYCAWIFLSNFNLIITFILTIICQNIIITVYFICKLFNQRIAYVKLIRLLGLNSLSRIKQNRLRCQDHFRLGLVRITVKIFIVLSILSI